jgi:hypothetical protein
VLGRTIRRRARLATIVIVLVAATALSGCAIGFRGDAIFITDQSATLRGDVLSDRTETGAYWFQYGTTSAYGQESPHQSYGFQAGVRETVMQQISGLDHHTTYHYSLCAEDQDPNVDALCSGDSTFTTVGDHVRGRLFVLTSGSAVVTLTFNDVRSGSAGQDPAGTVTVSGMVGDNPVTCLTVAGQKFTVGIEVFGGALYNLVFVDLSGSGTAAQETTTTPPTTCPAEPGPITPLLPALPDTGFVIHDEP